MNEIPLELTICSWMEFNKRVAEERFDAIVSVKNPSTSHHFRDVRTLQRHSRLLQHCNKVICLDFYDITDDRPSVRGPTRSVIEQIVRFARMLPRGSRVIVHCMAGISRSTAAAIILLREHGLSHEQALAEVVVRRPIAWPNKRMLDLYERVKDSVTPSILELLAPTNSDDDNDDSGNETEERKERECDNDDDDDDVYVGEDEKKIE